MTSPGPATAPHDDVVKSPAPAEDLVRDAKTEEREDADSSSDEEPGETKSDAGSDTEADEDPEAKVQKAVEGAPPLPDELAPDGPPLPKESVPESEDDGWDCQWDATSQAWFFYNRFTGKTQWENPRITTAARVEAGGTDAAAAPSAPSLPVDEQPAAGGYNPAIHGDYDPNAWYAKGLNGEDDVDLPASAPADPASLYGATATFNRHTGSFQTEDMGPERHTDEAKAKRQMNAYFDVDAAANAHGGRSLKAERSNKKPSKSELKAFKEKRRARKEEKRRAWLRD